MLLFDNEEGSTEHTVYYLPTVEIKDCNVMMESQKFFDQPVKNNIRMYKNIRKITTGNGDGYTTGCLLDYQYFNENCKMIAIDLSKQ